MHLQRTLDVVESLSKQPSERLVASGILCAKNEDATHRSRDDKRSLETQERTVKHAFDRYEVGMVCREEVKFRDNCLMAEKRLECTERKLKCDEELAKKYRDIIEDYADKRYA